MSSSSPLRTSCRTPADIRRPHVHAFATAVGAYRTRRCPHCQRWRRQRRTFESRVGVGQERGAVYAGLRRAAEAWESMRPYHVACAPKYYRWQEQDVYVLRSVVDDLKAHVTIGRPVSWGMVLSALRTRYCDTDRELDDCAAALFLHDQILFWELNKGARASRFDAVAYADETPLNWLENVAPAWLARDAQEDA